MPTLAAVTTAGAADLAVLDTSPLRHTMAPASTQIMVAFDKPVVPSSINASTFRVFGRGSGRAAGTFSFSGGNQVVTFTPASPFSAGEIVSVNLSHDIDAADATSLRAAGYYFSFTIAAAGNGTIDLQELDVMSNLEGDPRTRIYGVAATDLNNDGSLDIVTVNETSEDIRVALNRNDGTGFFHDFLPPEPISLEASPNEPADFDWDGDTDMCVAASGTDQVWILLGAGDGTFGSVTSVNVGSVPHGIMALDVDGDADWDIVNANEVSGNLSLMINNGAGVFGPAAFFDAGLNGEYGLATGDMNSDGISDLVVAAENGSHARTLLGNGNGTFTPAGPPVSTGGWTWVVTVGDANGDGHLDVAAANAFSNNVGILRGNGNGTFQPVVTLGTVGHTPGVEFGDLDGDDDLDLVASSFGAGLWRVFTNNGAGTFAFSEDIPAPANPSCAAYLDFDEDGDLDLALSDEIDDVVVLMENVAGATGVEQVGDDIAAGGPGAGWTASFPNPCRDAAHIRFDLPVAGVASLTLFDAGGRLIETARLGHRPTGISEHAWSAATTPSGVYFYEVHVDGSHPIRGKMVVAR
jgi:hypothetical protein